MKRTGLYLFKERVRHQTTPSIKTAFRYLETEATVTGEKIESRKRIPFLRAADVDYKFLKQEQRKLVWFGNLSRPKRKYFDFFWSLEKFRWNWKLSPISNSKLENTVEDCLRGKHVISVIPQLQEGGFFALFENEHEALESVNKYERTGSKPKCFLVKGQPFIHDIKSLLPTSTINVKISSGGLEVACKLDDIYEIFRQFGPIENIDPHEPRPNEVHVTYVNVADAASAMKCLNRFKFSTTDNAGQLAMVYDDVEYFSFAKYMMAHPRIFGPILLTLLGSLVYTFFDPIRVLSIETKIKYSGKIREKYAKYSEDVTFLSDTFIKKYIPAWLIPITREQNMSKSKQERLAKVIKPIVKDIKQELETDLTPIVIVSGPKGTGKSLVTSELCKDMPHVVLVDFSDHAFKSSNYQYFERKLSLAFGYFPNLLWAQRLYNNLEGILSSVFAIKAENLPGTQNNCKETVNHILQCANTAISRVCIDDKKQRSENERKSDPVVVNILFEGMNASLSRKNPWFQQLLLEWIDSLNRQHYGLIRAVFVSSDSALVEDVRNYTFLRVKEISLQDLSGEEAADFLSGLLIDPMEPSDVDLAISTIGGRLADIRGFASRVNSGAKVEDAISQYINDAVKFIRTAGLQQEGVRWNKEQLWYLIRKLSMVENLPSDDVIYSPLFGNETALRALAEANLISIVNVGENPDKSCPALYIIKPGRPLYTNAFEQLVENEKLRKNMDDNLLKAMTAKSEEKIRTWEKELYDLSFITTNDKATIYQIKGRREFLLERLAKEHLKIEQFHENLFPEINKEKGKR